MWKNVIYIFVLLAFCHNLFAHGNHAHIEINENFELKNKKKEKIAFRIVFESEKDKQKAQKKMMLINRRIKDVFKEACYEIKSDRGKALLRTDLFHNLSLLGIGLSDIVLRDVTSLI